MATPRSSGPAQLGLLSINRDSQQRIVDFMTMCKFTWQNNWSIRQQMTQIDREYASEVDWTEEQQKAKRANRQGDASKFQNVTLPIILPQVEAAVTYQASVFLSGVPIFPVVAAPVYMDAAIQLETILDRQSIEGGWKRHLMMMFRDGFKYNLAAMEVTWAQEKIPTVSTNISAKNSNSAQLDSVIWNGNRLKRLDMYNTWWDVRYFAAEVSERGEYAGYDEMISLVELKKYIATNPYIIKENIKPALESPTPVITIGSSASSYNFYIPQISNNTFAQQAMYNQFNWFQWAGFEPNGKQLDYKNLYMRSICYARIIPRNFNITNCVAPSTPQIWKLVFINNNVLLEAYPIPLAYDRLPILFTQPNEDGLGYQTKSLAERGAPFQYLGSSLINSIVHARRRSITDRVLYDPSRIAAHQINSDNPSAKIPIRPAAYGKPIAEAVYQFPYRDDQTSINMAEIQQMMNMADQINGQNRARQGQFQKGNKTRKEWEDVMGASSGRDQQTALLYEDQFFTPLKTMLKLNVLQFQSKATLYSRQQQAPVDVDPIALREASLEFQVTDGLTPTDKLIAGDTMAQALQVMGSSPQIAAAYNIGPAFSYLMKTQGADLSSFEKGPQQQAYEQAVGQWQQTCQMIVDKLAKIPDVDLSNLAKMLPPQPTPEQFQYVPGTLALSPRSPSTPTQSVLANYSKTAGASSGQSQGASTNVPSGQ